MMRPVWFWILADKAESTKIGWKQDTISFDDRFIGSVIIQLGTNLNKVVNNG